MGNLQRGPLTLTILPTYRCTAACRECCFESSPYIVGRIPLDRILSYIDEAAQSFPSLQLVCFSGGECFMLGKDLDAAIVRVRSHELMSRCVTNGYWASTEANAEKRIQEVREAGLTEINFSTGDEHQQFVAYDRVVNGAIAACEAGIKVVIIVEGYNEAHFTLREALSDQRLREFIQTNPHAANLQVIRNIWMTFHADKRVTQTQSIYAENCGRGCTNVFNNVVITPHEKLAACCGLTMEHIPEMKLGDLREHSIKELYESQYEDFLKIWISVDGPQEIYRFAAEKDPTICYDDKIAHMCHSCTVIHKDQRIRTALLQHYQEKIPEVLLRYHLSRQLTIKAEAVFRSELPGGMSSGFGA